MLAAAKSGTVPLSNSSANPLSNSGTNNGKIMPATSGDTDPSETQEWLESLAAVLRFQGPERAQYILESLLNQAESAGIKIAKNDIHTPYVNTIPVQDQLAYPGDRELERKIKSAIRWNAMAMVHRANRTTNVGGHIATYASAATLYEVGFNHFFRGRTDSHPGDIVYFQGHASPGMYARAYVEERLTENQLSNFRQELQPGGGLSSYPHPWLMPNFWQYPTVSMGLGPIMSIYQARYHRYLHNRNAIPQQADSRIWAFLGDGECDEPESLGCISLAGREKLNNLIWVINCNLQRLDGPVRGNGKIIQELEGIFRGANWNVIKVIWGSSWDDLLAADKNHLLSKRMMEVVDGEYQDYVGRSMLKPEERRTSVPVPTKEIDRRRGAFIREHFFNSPELKALVQHLSDEQIAKLARGGHDPVKVYNAYATAVASKDRPTVILAKTVKGYGMEGIGGEGANTAHQQKKIVARVGVDPNIAPEEAAKMQELLGLKEFRDRFQIPIPDAQVGDCPFYRPPSDSPEGRYLHERRQSLGGYQPMRSTHFVPCQPPDHRLFESLYMGTVQGKPQSTTLAWVTLMTQLCKDPHIGKLLVPIVPDEGQTFGMPPMYKQFGIYSSVGQKYVPVDKGTQTEYREDSQGQIFQEGINEAGSMSTFIAAGTAYSTYGVNTIPFYVYYAMFGFQRVGDLIWAAADSRCRGFLLGATAGRTTINGEGLQHEDGHSPLVAMSIPTCRVYDPAFAYELAVIIEDGIHQMYVDNHDCFYYLTIYNEAYEMPAMPKEDVRDGILRGLYSLKTVKAGSGDLEVQLIGSGVILNEVLRAQKILAEKYQVTSTVFSATSYQQLRLNAIEIERHNRLHPTETPQLNYLDIILGQTRGPIIASSDYMRAVPETIAPYLNGRLLALGTDGFGRSETRKELRRFFEVDAESIVVAALTGLAKEKKVSEAVIQKAIHDLGINPDRPHPWKV